MRREIPGPRPQQFGVIAKPIQSGPSLNILEKNKIINDNLEDQILLNKRERDDKIKMNFFADADRKARLKTINRQVDEIMNQRNVMLYERRQKLKAILAAEQQIYEAELLATIKSPLERAAELREKARQIRVNRDHENAQLVSAKLDEKWRSECDEIRTLKSKQLQAGLKDEHFRQMEEKVCRERHRLEEEAVFADLWHKDMLAKKEREENEAKKLAERNRDVSEVLKQQMQVLDDQKEEEKRLRGENIRLLHEMKNIEKLEEQMKYQKKLEDQANRRHELDLCVKAKFINEARRAKEELAFDLKALEDSLLSFQNEDIERFRRKQELFQEQKNYRDYLQQQYEEEKRREKELDRIVNEEVEKQFQKRLVQWKAEKKARKDLLEKVMAERQLQINDKLLRNKERAAELEYEKEQVRQLIDSYKQQDLKERAENIDKIKQYGSDLIQQMQYLNTQKNIERNQNQLEYQSYKQTEAQYHQRVRDTLKDLESKNPYNFSMPSGFCYKCRQDMKMHTANGQCVN